MDNIVTPVNAKKFGDLLRQAGYDTDKTRFIESRFTDGFPLHFKGNTAIRREADNLCFYVGSKTELWNKLMKEVQLKRVAGPFEKVPFDESYRAGT